MKKIKWKNVAIIVLLFAFGLICGFLLFKGIDNLNQIANTCDKAKGHTCSYYEIKQYVLGK